MKRVGLVRKIVSFKALSNERPASWGVGILFLLREICDPYHSTFLGLQGAKNFDPRDLN